jgi:ubiquinone/menaquinone biosynthesis C-methylase UbiE
VENFWETQVYAQGRQINRWPYDAVVSAIKRERIPIEGRVPRVLEMGCGTGNNLVFFCSEGFETYGLDISSTSLEVATHFLREYGYGANLDVSDLSALPFADDFFDVTIDRACFTHIAHSQLPSTVAEVKRVLVPGGTYFSFTLFGDQHPDKEAGIESETGTFERFASGHFQTVGSTSFFNSQILTNLFADISNVAIVRRCEYADDAMTHEEYRVRAVA